MPEPAPVTTATRPARGRGAGMRRNLASSSCPVLDAELLRLRDRRVGRDRLGAAHDPDRVAIELPRHPGGLRVLAETEHPDAWYQDDRRIGAPHRRRIGVRVPLVVRAVVVAVTGVQLAEAGHDVVDIGVSREVEQHRAHLRAQEMVRTRRAKVDKPRTLRSRDEVEHVGVIVEVAHLNVVRRRKATHNRRNRGRDAMAVGLRQRLVAVA